MKYFIDFEFIEGFHKPLFGKRRHFIDLISVGVVSEDNRNLHLISSEYRYKDADPWVRRNVIDNLYLSEVHGDYRNWIEAHNFHRSGFGVTNDNICAELLEFFQCYRDQLFWRAPEGIEVYGYYAGYDWVLLCSLFGRMIDLPKGFPMYCRDLKQMMDERGVSSDHPDCPKQKNEHNALGDAMWNREVYKWLKSFARLKEGEV